MKRFLALLPLLALPSCSQAQPARAPAPHGVAAPNAIERRLSTVTPHSMAAAVSESSRYIAAHPGAAVTIRLPSGTHDLSAGGPDRGASIDLSDVTACPGGLTIAGEGAGRTTIIKGDDSVGVLGRRTSCVTIADMTLMQRRLEVTQGKVVSASREAVVLDIPRGFPTPAALMAVPASRDSDDRARYWLRRYVDAPGGAQIVQNETAVRWRTAEQVVGAPNRWRFSIAGWRRTPVFPQGALIAVKTKSGGQAYRFTNGRNITFRGVRWINDSRGKFRGVNNVTVENCRIGRPPPLNGVGFVVSTSGGGPQIGHTADALTTGHLVQDNVFEATGDDAVAFAHASGTIRNNRISDVNRGVLLAGSPDVKLENNTLVRASVVRKAGSGRKHRRAANDNEPE